MYQFQKFVLENGIRVILAPAGTREISIWLFIKGGSQYETREEGGISHFTEHMIFRGTKKWPTHRLITERLDKIAMNHGAHTDLEETSYFITTQPRYFESALDLISDFVSAPLLRLGDIEKEKELIPQEIREGLDDPKEHLLWNLWQEVCFNDQPAGWPVCGEEEVIRTFTEDQIKKHFEKTYVSQRMVISIAGSIKPEVVLQKVKERFGNMKPGKIANSFPIKDHQKIPKVLMFYKDTQQSHLVVGVKTPFRPRNKEAYAVDVLAEILNFNIYLLLIGEKGLAYSTGTHYELDPTKSFLITHAGVGHPKADEAISIVLGEYQKAKNGEIEPEELTRATSSILKRMKEGLSKNSLVLAHFLGIQELYTGEILGVQEEFNRYKSLKIDHLRETAKLIFQPSNLNLAIIGPHRNEERFEKLLRNF